MFTNPFNRKYESGGSVPSKANSLVEKASKNSGVSVKELTNKMNEFSSDEAKGGAFAELIKSAASDEDTKERREAVASLKAMFKKSTRFEDGGKFQSFICKHGHGGVNCGCGGGKVITAASGDRVPKHRYVEREYGPDGSAIYTMAIERGDLPSNMRANPDSDYNQNGGEYQGNGQVRIVDRGIGPEGITIYSDPYSAINQGRVTNAADSLGYINTLRNLTNRAGIVLGPSFTLSEENGGILMGQDGLSRSQALTAAEQSMSSGENRATRAQARLAYRNAKIGLRNNSDLRGNDLRQAAREMIARPRQVSVPEMAQIDFNTLNNGTALSPIKDPQFIEEPMFTDEELNQIGDQAVNDAMSGLSRNTRNRGNNAIAGAVQHFATIAPSTVGAVNYGGYDTGKFGERVGNYLKTHGTELMAHPIYGTIKGLYNWLKKEDGGVIMGLDGLHLSRKQTRELSGLNKGYDREQFQSAMANADTALRNNTELRGRDLRQAKRAMVAGITPMERTVTMESSPAELNVSYPTAETISSLNPNLELPVREVATPTNTNISTRKPSRAAQALDNAVQYFATTAPSTVGAINYEGYRNPGQNFKDMWNHFTGLFKKDNGGIIKGQEGIIASTNKPRMIQLEDAEMPSIIYGKPSIEVAPIGGFTKEKWIPVLDSETKDVIGHRYLGEPKRTKKSVGTWPYKKEQLIYDEFGNVVGKRLFKGKRHHNGFYDSYLENIDGELVPIDTEFDTYDQLKSLEELWKETELANRKSLAIKALP